MTPQAHPNRTGGYFWGPWRVRLHVSLRELELRSGVNRAILSQAESGRGALRGKQFDAIMAALRAAEEGL